ncbi:MAG: glycosyltransferase family 2 protein [Desulfurococcales archaeon]|nr:glycosyltransferase family 2 protein [Desulfurococcales archaeon]
MKLSSGNGNKIERVREYVRYDIKKRHIFNFHLKIYILLFVLLLISPYLFYHYVANHFYYSNIYDILWYSILSYIKYIWILYAPIVILIAVGIIDFGKNIRLETEIRNNSVDYKVIFQITTRGFNIEALRMSVESIDFWAPRYFGNEGYETWIVTEEPDRKREFEKYLLKNIKGYVRIVYVPKEYVTQKHALHKARALNYVLNLRRKEGMISDKLWVYLMDEESIVGEDTVLSIRKFIDTFSQHNMLVSQGIVVYSNLMHYGTVTAAGEGIRPVWELGTEYIPSKYFGSKFSWKGSHLLFRSDLEDRVGWDINVFGDDLVFGLKAQELSKVGFLEGFLYEQHPFTYRESVRQKIRWYKNIIDIFLRYRPLKIYWRLMLFIELMIWHASLFGLFLWMVANPLDPLFLSLFLITYLNTIYGIELNCHFASCSRLSKIKKYVLVLVSLFVIAISPWIGIIEYIRDMKKGRVSEFYVVKK